MQPNPWRNDFPALRRFDEQDLTYLDNAATTQKPQQMLDALTRFYQDGVANTHRSGHSLANYHTDLLEENRSIIANWLKIKAQQLIFTKNATESCNLLAYGLEHLFKQGDEIVVSALEHHANLLPWQQLAKRKQLKLVILPINPAGIIDLQQARNLISDKCRLIAISALSNIFGALQPLKELADLARSNKSLLIIDAAQSIAFNRENLAIGDFFFFSAHKVYGPDGLGILVGKNDVLTLLKPWQTGGAMLHNANFYDADFLSFPHGFEAGTQALGLINAFAHSIKYLQNVNYHQYLQSLQRQLLAGLEARSYIKILGKPDANLISFSTLQVNTADVAYILNEQGILSRYGKHCAIPLFSTLDIDGVIRISLALYNNADDLNHFFNALDYAFEILL